MIVSRRSALVGAAVMLAARGVSGPLGARAATTRLVGVIEEDPPFFNPAISSTISSFVAGSPVYSALMRVDGTGKFSGDLAESWDVSPDGMVYTFHLRHGITWHDGAPFSSADVAFSIGQISAKLHPYRGALNAIDAYETPDANTVVLRLKHPQGSLMISLTNFITDILPKHIWEGKDFARDPHNLAPIGTGPFKFVEFVPGDHILYARNDKYFLPGLPAADELLFRIMPDPSARVAAFENGEIDMIYSSAVPASSIDRLRKMPGTVLRFSKLQQGGYQAYINMRNAPFSDKRVRHALAHTIDRGFIRATVFPGGLAQNMVGPVAPSSELYNTALKDYALDPARAEALLDDAGFKRGADGTRFSLRYVFGAADLPASKIGDIMSRNLAAVGIKVILRPVDRGTYLQMAFVNDEFDMVAGSFNLGPDPDVGVERFYNSHNIFNIPFVNNSPYVNHEVDALFDQQRVQTDPAKRKAIYDRIQEIVWEDIPVFPFCAYSLPGVVHDDVAGVFLGHSSLLEDFAFAKPAV
jgi:peptide/nickel transport system substrate-binding protein